MLKINKVKKNKEQLTYLLKNIDEFKTIDFKKIIPENAKSIELSYNDKDKILKIDYLTFFEITE